LRILVFRLNLQVSLIEIRPSMYPLLGIIVVNASKGKLDRRMSGVADILPV